MPEGCRIITVEQGSPAERAGIIPGDRILSLNGHPVRDVLDAAFYGTEPVRSLECVRKGKRLERRFSKPLRPPLGIEWEEIRPRSCCNRCIFCFIHQLPSGLRKSLYFKDEDYRLSFIFGNYITATNLSEGDFDRIVSQKFSPLYISVHTTDSALRRKILGNPKAPDILPVLKRLKRGGIRFHTQIVLMPGINDGAFLDRTIDDLAALVPALHSIAVVPVGLTDHRQNLPRLEPVSPDYAGSFLKKMNAKQREMKKRLGDNRLFISDEFYLLAGRRPPMYTGYDEIPQLENGVGMAAAFYRGFAAAAGKLPQRISPPRKVALITGTLGEKLLGRFLSRMNRIQGLDLRTIVVENRLFGDLVTVSGLMSGRDIEGAIAGNPGFDLYILPENCLNTDGVFLDDLSPGDLEKNTAGNIAVGRPHARDLIDLVLGQS